MRLRWKLLLIALVASVFPLAGYRFVSEMEASLRQGQEQALLASARALAQAALVLEEPDLRSAASGTASPVRVVGFELSLDAFDDDWRGFDELRRMYTSAHPGSWLALRLALSSTWLYLYAEVGDDSAVRSDGLAAVLERSDHLLVEYAGSRYRVDCRVDGPFEAAEQPGPSGRFGSVLVGACRLTPAGYVIEARLPWRPADRQLAVVALDFPVPGADLPRAQSGTIDARGELAPLSVVPVGAEARRLAPLLPTGSRLRIYDTAGWLRARAGALDRVEQAGPDGELGLKRWLRLWVYRWLLAPELRDPAPYRIDLLRPDLVELEAALRGEERTAWRPSMQRSSVVLSAFVPIRDASGVLGAVLLEQPSDALLVWANRSLGSLLLAGLLGMLLAAAILFGYASFLAWRIRQLRNAAESALTPDGRLSGGFPRSRARDELGDLSRSFARLLDQLRDYHDYLRTLAGKLSHELSTPLAIVRSSLENLEHESLPATARTYATRARDGTERLAAILRAMSEATQVERAIAASEAEDFDLRQVVVGAASAYADLLRGRRLETEVPSRPLPFHGAPELIHQALDKLIANARDYTPEQGWIRLTLKEGEGVVELAVANQGPPLPSKIQDKLFESLVSDRSGRPGAPHLGLGLYIVRLVAEAHRGEASAANLPQGEGVVVRMRLRGMPRRAERRTAG